MGLMAHIDAVPNLDVLEPDAVISPGEGTPVTRLVYGREASFSYVSRPPHYHGRPHAHDREQLSLILRGELSVFVVDEGSGTIVTPGYQAHGYEYRLRRGDYLNIPPMAVHWTWNRATEECILLEAHAPARNSPAATGLFDPSESTDGIQVKPTYQLSERYADGEEEFPAAPEDSPWLARAETVTSTLNREAKNFGYAEASFAFGERTNLLLFSIAEGFHSRPHIHVSEQVGIILEGRFRMFIDGKAYWHQKGDFFRIPGMAVHWTRNDGPGACLVSEAHAPVLDTGPRIKAMPVVPKERLPFIRVVGKVFLPDSLQKNEAAMIAAATGEE